MTDAAELLAATPVVASGSGNDASSLEHTGPVTPALVPAPLPAFPSGSSAASSGSATSGAGAPAGPTTGAPTGAAATSLHERASHAASAVSSAAAAPAEAAEAGAPNTVSVGGSHLSAAAAAVISPASAAVLQLQTHQQQTQWGHTPLGYIAAALRARSAAAADLAAVLHGGANGMGSGRGGVPPSPILLAGKCVRP